MKSQDIFLLLKLLSLQQRQPPLNITSWQDWENQEDMDVFDEEESLTTPYTMRSLAKATGISKSEISLALQRCYAVTLAKPDRSTGIPSVNIRALEEFIIHGIRYVFPAKLQAVTRGIATGLAAPVLIGEIMTAGELLPVWTYAYGKTMMGQAVEPLYKTVPYAVQRDTTLYALLALTDAIRLGQARERAVASDKFSKMLKAIG